MKRIDRFNGELHNTKGLQAIRRPKPRNQSLYRFSSLLSFTSHNLNSEDPQLPHYVVPVLYVPQRILTTNELNNRSSHCRAIESLSCEKIHRDRPFSPNYSLGKSECISERLTDSETEIYEKLMETMYGIKSSENIDYYKGDYEKHQKNHIKTYEDIVRDYIETGQDYTNENYSTVTDSSISSTFTRTISKQVPVTALDVSPFSSMYTRTADFPFVNISGNSTYSVTPAKIKESSTHKDDKATTTKLTVLSPAVSGTIVMFGKQESETKCTQTKIDFAVSTQTNESKVSRIKREIQCETHLGDALVTSAEMANLNKGSGEDVENIVDNTANYTESDNLKCDKSNESLPSVDLLAVRSSTLQRLCTVEK